MSKRGFEAKPDPINARKQVIRVVIYYINLDVLEAVLSNFQKRVIRCIGNMAAI